MAGKITKRFEAAGLFTKSFGKGWKLEVPVATMPQELALVLKAGLPVKTSINRGRRLLSIMPCLLGCAGQKTVLAATRDDILHGFEVLRIAGQDAEMEQRLSSRSYKDVQVELVLYLDGLGVIAMSCPTEEQLRLADSTEPRNKVYRRAPAQDANQTELEFGGSL